MRLVSPIIKRWTLQVMHILRMHGRDAMRMSRDWAPSEDEMLHLAPDSRITQTYMP